MVGRRDRIEGPGHHEEQQHCGNHVHSDSRDQHDQLLPQGCAGEGPRIFGILFLAFQSHETADGKPVEGVLRLVIVA
jgi:hypothetical protein